MWNKIKPILLTFALIWLIGSCVITKTKADTAISTNILPNAGTTSSNMDNFDLDGVQSGSTGFLNNNSTHNGRFLFVFFLKFSELFIFWA